MAESRATQPVGAKTSYKFLPLRERILAMGPFGSGKTLQWMRMAKYLKPVGVKFWVIDTDADKEYMLAANKEFVGLSSRTHKDGNVNVFQVFEWPEYRKALAEIKSKYGPNDWVVVDMAENAWKKVQEYFIEQIFGKNKGEYFLQARKSIQDRGGIGKDGKQVRSIARENLDGWKDWPVINALYDDFMLPIVYQLNCNVYLATRADTITRDEKDADILTEFGEYGFKPAGQKQLGHQCHTVLLLTHVLGGKGNSKGHWNISTIKDRGDRPYYLKTRLTDFFMQYLVGAAGWEVPEE